MVDVYEYLDYRALLKDLYKDRKNKNPIVSYRYLGQKAGFKSAGYFANVLNGKCNISTTNAFKLAEVFKLKKHEMEYLGLLVQYATTSDPQEKNFFFEKIISQKKSKLKKLRKQQYEFFNNWYYLVIREILNIYPFKGDDFKTLAKLCYPKVSAKEAEKAFHALEKMGMIQKNPYGYYEQVDSILTTGDDWSSQAIVNFQSNTMELAKNALNNCPRAERDISTLTLSISSDELKQIKDKLGTVQREILEIAKNAKKSDRVYQMNFQVFPLSSKPEDEP